MASQKNSSYSVPSIAGLGNCKPAAPPFCERGFCDVRFLRSRMRIVVGLFQTFDRNVRIYLCG
jgi:hypothetical protein